MPVLKQDEGDEVHTEVREEGIFNLKHPADLRFKLLEHVKQKSVTWEIEVSTTRGGCPLIFKFPVVSNMPAYFMNVFERLHRRIEELDVNGDYTSVNRLRKGGTCNVIVNIANGVDLPKVLASQGFAVSDKGGYGGDDEDEESEDSDQPFVMNGDNQDQDETVAAVAQDSLTTPPSETPRQRFKRYREELIRETMGTNAPTLKTLGQAYEEDGVRRQFRADLLRINQVETQIQNHQMQHQERIESVRKQLQENPEKFISLTNGMTTRERRKVIATLGFTTEEEVERLLKEP
jgi:hypothetical protein